MIPRGLTGRIVLAFTGLALALLLTLGAALFLALRQLHYDATRDSLSRQVAGLVVALAQERPAQWDQTVQEVGQSIADDGGFVLVQNPTGAIRTLAGSPSSMAIPASSGSDGASSGTLRTSDGEQFIYVETSKGTAGRIFVFALPDRSAQLAAADIARGLPFVLLILLLVGAPTAWLLARSVKGPMRRLALAAAGLPAATRQTPDLPLEGPTEVRALTERFNAMAHELAVTRDEETQLLANLRHDLRTPLTSITGFAEAIADGTASGQRARTAARTIAEEAERLERLVGELGVVERLREGPAALRPEQLDTAVLLDATAARFASRAGGLGVTIETQPTAEGEPPLVFTGDRLAVERILQNVVDNAVSVLPRGGHVWLCAAPLQLPGRPPGISLSVTDDGPGFPPGTLEKVFERFFRADPARSGTGSGLGLAIVRELARAHGGEAWAENVAPHGARVTVLLPIVPVVPVGQSGPGPAAGGESKPA
jgi:two-component system OmpR family sensor kinase